MQHKVQDHGSSSRFAGNVTTSGDESRIGNYMGLQQNLKIIPKDKQVCFDPSDTDYGYNGSPNQPAPNAKIS